MDHQLMTIDQQRVGDDVLLQHLNNIGLLKDLSEGEKDTFLQIAKAYNLNPFKREIHVSKYGNQMSIITGYEVYIKRAERTGQLDGWEIKTEGSVNDNSLKAILTIHRKDRQHPFVWEVNYSEYVQLKDGKPNKFWQKAHTMTKKVAISQGFRLCFSDELGGMPYTSDEIQTEDTEAKIITSIVKETWQPTEQMWNDAELLIKNSTLDENGQLTASNSLTNSKSQKDWDRILNRLRELQVVA
jgi:phage recombination protein Bet